MSATPDHCARHLLDAMPLVMRAIRVEMRQTTPDLSVPQFRALGFVSRNEGASLSDVASHIGLTLPSMSKLIDGLVARKLMTRVTDRVDRRRVTLALTPRGATTLQASLDATRAHLAARLAALTASERGAIVEAMRLLQPVFAPGWAADAAVVG